MSSCRVMRENKSGVLQHIFSTFVFGPIRKSRSASGRRGRLFQLAAEPLECRQLLAGCEAGHEIPLKPTIDLVGPDVVLPDIIGQSPMNSDTGMSGLDNVTRGIQPDDSEKFTLVQLAVTAELESQIQIWDGAQLVDTFTIPAPSVGSEVRYLFRRLQLVAGPHVLHVESRDPTAECSSRSEDLVVTVDFTAPPFSVVELQLLKASDSGIQGDLVTNKMQPAFRGLAEHNAKIRLFAQGELVGQGVVNSDESNTRLNDGLGTWEITVEPLVDGTYRIVAEVEDLAGNISRGSAALNVTIDTRSPQRPTIDLVGVDVISGDVLGISPRNSDTGMSGLDNVTRGFEPDPENNRAEVQVSVSAEPRSVVLIKDGEDVIDRFVATAESDDIIGQTFRRLSLSEGPHLLSVEAIDSAFNRSAQSHELLVTVDVTAPARPDRPDLISSSDSGMDSMDNVTSVMSPAFVGRAENGSRIRIFATSVETGETQLIGQGVVDSDESDGPQTLNGTGSWEITVEPLVDGVYDIVVQLEDLAGNVSESSDAERIEIVTVQPSSVITAGPGPRITNVTFGDVALRGAYAFDENTTSVFQPKPTGGPDPLISSIVVHFQNTNAADNELADSIILRELAAEEGNYQLRGDANGPIPILQAIPTFDIQPGQFGTVRVELVVHDPGDGVLFNGDDLGAPLPDDRYTLSVFDGLADSNGNRLDGESGAQAPFVGANVPLETPPVFPTGDGQHGGDFVARFTVDSRPEVGVWAAGSEWIDTNGNELFDPNNFDSSHRDIVYRMGVTSDDIFSGNFATAADDLADGFDKLAAYGRVNGTFRWLVDTDNDGVPDVSQFDAMNINGLPVAGRFDGSSGNGDEVGVYTGRTWHFDTDHDFLLDTSLPSQLVGYPVVGDFDGDGFDDLATWADDRFSVDLALGTLRGWDGVADFVFQYGFIGVRERPVAADLDQDGFDDLGVWVPDREGVTQRESSEWYFLVSHGQPVIDRITTEPIRGRSVVQFAPYPFGHDRFIQYGDDFALPLLGNFDPPTSPYKVRHETQQRESEQRVPENLSEHDDVLEDPAVSASTAHTSQHAVEAANSLDVNRDGVVSPLDALLILNGLHSDNSSPENTYDEDQQYTYDINGDGTVSPLDVLLIINRLSQVNLVAAQSTLVKSELDSAISEIAEAVTEFQPI